MIKVRIAPSPTGIPHIGNTRTALFNYLFAKKNKGEFVLRIEDTDRARFVPEAEKAIFEILEWLGIEWDGDVHKQSENLDKYKKYADVLVKKKLAYEDERAIRFKMPKNGETSWIDLIGNKKIVFKNETQEDFVILKSDQFPTYNFANVIDDHLMDITDVLRGEEFISSTPKHIALYKALGWNPPNFAHLPVILGPDKAKLSKRHGAKSVLDYRNEGYLKEAVLNYMVLLGWNPGKDREFLNIDEMIKLFNLKDINTASPVFDVQKLEWMNGEYIRMKDDKSLKNLLSKFYDQDKEVLKVLEDSNLADKIIELSKTRIKTLKEFRDLVLPKRVELSAEEKNIAKTLLEKISEIEKWNKDVILSAMKEVISIHKTKGSALYKIVTGFEKGLPLPESLEILGKEKTIERIRKNI